ncbi:MAG: Protein MraZ [Candidatus Daviesbacteria bacterium GW2011_GWC1_40_9]|nr:MAG: Protein MraZ [Candidatus Daviesbacteria bacterium GW2011_GWC1_40_9]
MVQGCPERTPAVFLGEYHTKFTGQGRIILPKKFRFELSGGKELILSRGFEGCIWGFSIEKWKNEAEKQLEITATEEKARNLRRYLFSAAESVVLDDQGRFIISKLLLDYAQLKGEVVIVGAGDHFEIWDPLKWQKLISELMI